MLDGSEVIANIKSFLDKKEKKKKKLKVWTRGSPKRLTHPPQPLRCGHEVMLNSLQQTPGL